MALAEEVGGPEHRFRMRPAAVQPRHAEAFTLPNQGAGREVVPLIEAARQLGIYVTSSASIYQGQLARNLPPVIAQFLPGLDTDAQRAMQFVRSTPGVGTALVGMKSGRARRRGGAAGGGVARALVGIPEALRARVNGPSGENA